MRFVSILFALLATIGTVPAHAVTAQGYTYYSIGDVAAPTPAPRSLGLMLMGGGGWSLDAFRWFAANAGHGHIVVLRASGGADAGEEIYKDVGGVASVETLVFDDRKAAFDPKVAAILAHADGIFIAGGDQSNYVRYWQGTPVAAALDAHVKKGRPIGGTSAGLAILGGGGAYGAMDGGSIVSQAALADPRGPAVTIVHGFLAMPFLSHVITDTHFTARSRLGRLVAFIAQTRADGDPQAFGIGVDEASALCVDAAGRGRLYTMKAGHAWLVEPVGAPRFASDKALDWPAVRITGIGTDGAIDLNTRKVTNPAFMATASVRHGELIGAPWPPGAGWTLAIHGGAGVIARGDLTPEQDRAYRDSLNAALATGGAVLDRGGSSLDAVEATVRLLEDNPLFNAGKGAVFDAEGKNQLDAAIMDGATARAGAVAAVSTARNPIVLARAVMEHSPHVLLTGPGADQFAREQGVEQVDPSYFRTDKRWQEYLEWKRDQHASLDPTHKFGTVGAVAMDRWGHLAAATSTGGLTGKRWGRIGDSPIVGAGTYALDGACAVSATGTGEYFIRESAARQVCDRIAWKGESVQAAAGDTIDEITELGGDGGLVAIDGKGSVGFAMNSEGMYRGRVTSSAPAAVAIYADERIDGR